MNARLGKYIIQKTAGESFKAYVPPPLPPQPPIDLGSLYPALERATLALAELNAITRAIPNTSLFIYMYVRKEALLSSQIEGTQSSFSDLMLFEHDQKPQVSVADVEEVSNYVKAIHFGLKRLKGGFPLSLRLIREIHKVLLSGSRGSGHLPGEFRRSQNWIGGTRPGNALFVPPPVDHLTKCLGDFEAFLHDETLPVLIRAGLAHVQFQTLHPFLDGNGRLGRLLIVLLLCNNAMLDEPILYLSLYLKQRRRNYYNLLQEVRLHGTWETWLEFFLDCIYQSAKSAIKTASDIDDLFAQDLSKIASLGRARFSCEQIFEYLKKLPQITVPKIATDLNMTAPTARSSLNHLVELGLLEEMTGKKRDRVYVYRRYLDILEKGTEPIKI
jgi:Fic family protein